MWLDRYRAILCDLDGCLISGRRVMPGARELIAYAGSRLWILSNNSTHTSASLAVELDGMGLPIRPNRLILAGAAAVDLIAHRNGGARVAIHGTADIVNYAEAVGLIVSDQQPDVVLLTRDPGFSYARLNLIIRQLEQGARLVVSNTDATHPGADGYPVAETGALLSAVKASLPDLDFLCVGKPNSYLYERVLSQLSSDLDEILAIGDSAETDGKGADEIGISHIIVGGSEAARYASLHQLLGITQDDVHA